MIVPKADLGIASARSMAGYLVANELLGPRSGLSLFAVGMVLPFGAQGAAVLLGAWLFTRIELPARPEAPTQQHIGHDIVEGLRWIRHNRAIRTLSLVIFVFNLTWGHPGESRPLGAGTASASMPSASDCSRPRLASAGPRRPGYDRLERRVSLATLMKACLTLEVLLHLALAFTTHLVVALSLMFVFGCYAFVWGSVSNAVRMRATPDAFQGRVGSVYFFGMTTGLLVGQFLGGLIATKWGVAAPFWFAFVGAG